MSTKLLSETICRKGIMVKCFVALIVFCCSVGEAFAQTDTKVTINVNNVLIRTALDQLQREAKIHFVYDEENIDSGKRVSLFYTKTSLNAVLDDFCKQTSLRYEVKRNLILILPSKAEKTTGKHEPFYMTGVVMDETGESIIGATIMIGGTSQGTVTDIDGRYSLRVTPGDLVSFTFEEFSGIGAEANNYMKFRLFPKGGSYLEAGGNLRGDFVSTKALVDSLAAIRMHTLDTLSNVSDAFKKQETARIKADIINSYICYASYSRMFAGVKNEEEMRAKWNEFNVSLTQDVTPLYKEIMNEDMLNVAVVRDVLSYQEDSTLASLWFKDISIPARTTELYACAKIVDNLRNEASEQTVNEAKAFLQTVKNADFVTEIEGKIVQASKLLPGQPAIDFEMLDVEGNVKHLADFRGKVIYIDLWATWCGPCIQESPAFEALGKKYAGKDIVFLPVSTDTTTKPWLRYLDGHKKELTQYHSNDVALKESWAIMYIPRFILIDKDFNIVNAYAPRPSSEEIGTLIDSVLNK